MSDKPACPGKSEKRQRTEQLFVRLTPDEKAAFLARANKAGMSAAAFLRMAVNGDAGPRAQRRVPVDAALMRQVLGHLGRIGNNLNQIARHLNTGREGDQGPALAAALAEYADMRDMLYVALGKDPDHAPPAQPVTRSTLPPVSEAFAAAAASRPRNTEPPAATPAPEPPPASPAAPPAVPPQAPPAQPGSRFVGPRPPTNRQGP